ncbi:MAG: PilN domain-containing protein, partial [Geminicoccaceae bacterium]
IHSHILQLNVDGSSIELFGLAGKASDLITALDRSAMMTAPTFNSAVTRETQSGKERFHILVDLLARGD